MFNRRGPRHLLLAVTLLLFPCTSTRGLDLVFPGETWEVVAPEDMQVDSQRLELATALLPDSSRTMVIRNGRVIWQGSDVDSPTGIASITKAFASTALGLLVDDGVLTVDTPVADYNPALADQYGDVTFGHLTTQTSNVQGNILAPAKPYFEPSGSEFYYNTTGGNNALSHGLQVAAGQTLEEFLIDRIAEPIGMDTDRFDFSETPLRSANEELVTINTAHTGLQTTANNVARFGLLFMNDGEWDGERILSEEWVQQATSVQVGSDVPVHTGSDFTGFYGMGGWFRFAANSLNSYGSGNSRLFVDPAAGFVVASLRNEGGATTHAASNAMITALYDAEIPMVWDGQGDGTWHQIDSDGYSRWLLAGQKQTQHPTMYAVVRDRQVEIDQELRVRRARVESGGHLRVESALDVGELTIDNSTVAVHSEVLAEVIEVDRGSLILDEDAFLQATQFTVNQGTARLVGSAEIGRMTTVREGELTIGEAVAISEFALRGGTLRFSNGSSPLHLTAGSQSVRGANLTFLIDGPLWERTFTMAPSVRRWSGPSSQLTLELTPESDPQMLAGAELRLFDWGAARVSEFESISIPSRIDADLSDFYSTGIVRIESVAATPMSPGDFNGDELLDNEDIDLLASRIRVGSQDFFYDTDRDDLVGQSDFEFWLAELKGTKPGDANLDGEVSFEDFLELQSGFGTDGGHAAGDFDLSGEVDFGDFLILSANFGGSAEIANVPEPRGISAYGLLWLVLCFRRSWSSAN